MMPLFECLLFRNEQHVTGPRYYAQANMVE